MYACQLMVPCVDSALKSTKSSPRLGAVRGQGSGLRVSCAGSQWGACERKRREGLGAFAPIGGESAVLAQFAFLRYDYIKLDAIISQKDRTAIS